MDDTADVRDLYAEYFTALGFRVAKARDGQSGIAAATRYRPDVIVMDLSMLKIDGEQGALEAGADVFLTTPCLAEDLEGHVRRRRRAA